METTNADANATPVIQTIADEGISSVPRGYSDEPDTSAATIQTVDVELNPKVKADADDKGGENTADGQAGAGDKTGGKGQEGRFDQHPGWQAMVKRTEEAEQRATEAEQRATKLEGMVEVVLRGGEASAKPEVKPATYIDITTKSDDELREWQEDDPKGYAANLYAQINHEISENLRKETEAKAATGNIQKTYQDYSSRNPDFQKMWDSGEIPRFMQANPGHNAISAHKELTSGKVHEDANAYMAAAIDKAVKETEERVIKNFQAKKAVQGIEGAGGSISRVPAESDDELKNTNQRGGLVSVIAERLERRRRTAAGG
jgi:hypothetical protein